MRIISLCQNIWGRADRDVEQAEGLIRSPGENEGGEDARVEDEHEEDQVEEDAVEDDKRVTWGVLMPGMLFIWVIGYWMWAVFREADGELDPVDDLVEFMRHYGHYWYWLLGGLFLVLLTCVTPLPCGVGPPPSCGRPRDDKSRFELCCRMAARRIASVKYSGMGIFLLDRLLKVVDIVSDYLVLFCKAEWKWRICPHDGLWWGEDWWWARFALFFTLSTVVVVWVVTAPIWVKQIGRFLHLCVGPTMGPSLGTVLSMASWLAVGLPTIVLLDFVMLLRYPLWDPAERWLTNVSVVQKVVEAILEAPVQALLQAWIFRKSAWIEHRMGDDIPIPWMLIISLGTSALSFLMIVADIYRQAKARGVGLVECLRGVVLVSLEPRPLQLHMLRWRKVVSYETQGALTQKECREIAKVAGHCPNLERLIFKEENRVSVDSACVLLEAGLTSKLEVSSSLFQLKYEGEEPRSLSLSLNKRRARQVAEDAKELLKELEKVLKAKRAATGSNDSPATDLVEFLYVCLLLRSAFGIDEEEIAVGGRELEELRFKVTIGDSEASYDGREKLLRVNLREAAETGGLLAQLPELIQHYDLEFVSASPFNDEQLTALADLPIDGYNAKDKQDFIKVCSLLEAIFNDQHQYQVRLTKAVLAARGCYEVPQRASYSHERRRLVVQRIGPGSESRWQRYVKELKQIRTLYIIEFNSGEPLETEQRKWVPRLIEHLLLNADKNFVAASEILVHAIAGLQRCMVTWSTSEKNKRRFEAEGNEAEGKVVLDWCEKCLKIDCIDAIQPQDWARLSSRESLRSLEVRLHGNATYDWNTQELIISDSESIGARDYRWIQRLGGVQMLDIGSGNGVDVAGCEVIGAFGELPWLRLGAANNIGLEGCQFLRTLRNLRTLEIGDRNGIGSEGCGQISSLTMLEWLRLGGENDICQEGCQHLKELTQLKDLDIGGSNNIGEQGCRHLAKLRGHLQSFKIGGGNGVASGGCLHLKGLEGLTHLEIGEDNNIGIEGCGHLPGLRDTPTGFRYTLTQLKIGDRNAVGAGGCEYINDLGALTYLEIGDENDIGHGGCKKLSRLSLKQLTRLSIGGRNQINEEACISIAQLQTLEHLEIGAGNRILAGGCGHVQHLKKLQELKIGGGNKIGVDGCQYLSQLRSLTRLTIGGDNEIITHGCRHLGQLKAKLKQLEIGGGNKIGVDGCQHLSQLRSLTGLTIGGDNEIIADGCRHLGQLKALKQLEIGDNNQIGDAGCVHLKTLSELEELKIGDNNQIGEEGRSHLKALPKLQKERRAIGKFQGVGDDGYASLAEP